MSVIKSIKREVGEWTVRGDVIDWGDYRSVGICCERPDEVQCEQRTLSRRLKRPAEECFALLDELFEAACMGLSGACAAQGEKVAK